MVVTTNNVNSLLSLTPNNIGYPEFVVKLASRAFLIGMRFACWDIPNPYEHFLPEMAARSVDALHLRTLKKPQRPSDYSEDRCGTFMFSVVC